MTKLNINKFYSLVLISVGLSFLTGCLVSEDATDIASQIGEENCISATAVAYDGVEVKFKFPEEASKFMIKRDGQVILETSDRSLTSKIDSGLIKGQSYRYSCFAMIDVNEGYSDLGQELLVDLESDTPPRFGGIINARQVGPESVEVEWALSSDEVISHYKVYKSLGRLSHYSEFNQSAVATIYDLGKRRHVIENLGDQMDYSFRVVACNRSDVCDTNNSIETLKLPDTGAPDEGGLSDIEVVDGRVRLTAPWDDTRGLIVRRSIYKYELDDTSAMCPTFSTADYNETSVVVSDYRNVPISFNAPGEILQGKKYCYVVRDTDGSQYEMNTTIRSIAIGDLTKPNFTSTLSVSRSSTNPETELDVSWLAMQNEQENSLEGAYEYTLFIHSQSAPYNNSQDPCIHGEKQDPAILASNHSSGTQVTTKISGLSPREFHRVCLKVKDSSGNIADNKPTNDAYTGDTTPPLFAGLDSAAFNANGLLDFTFTVPPDSDVQKYVLKMKRNRGGTTETLTDVNKVFGVLPPGSEHTFSVSKAEIGAETGDTYQFRLEACDNAAPQFNSQVNCTSNLNNELSVYIPNIEPPSGFNDVSWTAKPGSTTNSALIEWSVPSGWDFWSEYDGFRVHIENENGDLVDLDSDSCICPGQDCAANPINSCEVERIDGGSLLEVGKAYRFVLSGFNDVSSTLVYQNERTFTGRTRDNTAPLFNANTTAVSENGATVTFNEATDDQFSGSPDNLALTYQIYKKQGSDFNFDCAGFPDDPSCDVMNPLYEGTQSGLTKNGNTLSFSDSDVDDALTYYYKICVYDAAYADNTQNPDYFGDKETNRTCQTGSSASVTIDDTVPPVLSNYSSTKKVNQTNWTISFEVSDATTDLSLVSVEVFRGTSGYPDATGVPYKSKGAGLTVDASGNATFSDVGNKGSEQYYYTVKANDGVNDSELLQFRDTEPAPVIASVEFVGGDLPNNEVKPDLLNPDLPATQTIRINGSNLASVRTIRDGANNLLCSTNFNSWNSLTDSAIVCETVSGTDYGDKDIQIQSKNGATDVVSNAIRIRRHCEIFTDRNSMESFANNHAVCFPEHFNAMQAVVDSDVRNTFLLMQDIDFNEAQSSVDFSGLSNVSGDRFRFKGRGHTITNMTITETSTDLSAGIVKRYTSQPAINEPLFSDTTFVNMTVTAATNKGSEAVGALFGVVDAYSMRGDVIDNVSFQNLNINADGSRVGGLIGLIQEGAFHIVNIDIDGLTIETNNGTAQDIGGVVGRQSSNYEGNQMLYRNISMNDFTFNPANNAISVGGLIGRMESKTFTKILDNSFTNIQLGHLGAATDYIGGLIGRIRWISGSGNGLQFFEVKNNTLSDIELVSGGTNATSSFGCLFGYSHAGRDNVVSQNHIECSFQGSGNQTQIGGLIGEYAPNDNRMTDYNYEFRENKVVFDVKGGFNTIGGLFGLYKLNYRYSNKHTLVEDNYINITSNFEGFEDMAGLVGRCEHNQILENNLIEYKNNYLAVIKPPGTITDYDPVISSSCYSQNPADSDHIFTNNYYDTDLTQGEISSYEATGAIEGRSTSDLIDGASLSDTFVGWDFTNIWKDESANSQRPSLQWESN